MRLAIRLAIVLTFLFSCVLNVSAAGKQPLVVQEQPLKNYGQSVFKRSFDDGTSDVIEIVGKLKTSVGLVRVVRKQYDDKSGFGSPSLVLLGNVEIFMGQGGYEHLYGAFDVRGRTYILVGDNCGGSGCRYDDLSFLELNGSERATVITNKDFYSEDNSVKAKTEKGRIFVALGLFKGLNKTAVLESGELHILYNPAPYKPLTANQCNGLYEIAEDCIKVAETRTWTCEVEAADLQPFANSRVWAFRYLKNQPGFDAERFATSCINACISGTREARGSFSKSVCDAP